MSNDNAASELYSRRINRIFGIPLLACFCIFIDANARGVWPSTFLDIALAIVAVPCVAAVGIALTLIALFCAGMVAIFIINIGRWFWCLPPEPYFNGNL